jgi:nucleoside-diphosphate-sugar epimerase/glycosyltransferase involved in cell wall biosynthesis
VTGAAELTISKIRGVRVFVTGGSGFIGRAVSRLLMKTGAEVLNYDLRPWPAVDSGPRTVIGDIEDADGLSAACRSFDPAIFIHLAAFASVTATSRDDFSSIWHGTRLAAKAFAETSQPQRFVNISTQLVIRPGLQPKDLFAYDPYTPYGDAKAEAERFLQTLDRPYAAVHVRPTNIWGPHHPSYAKSVMRYLENGWYLHPDTPRPVVRTYGYVDNCAGQIISAGFSGAVSDGDVLYCGDEAIDSAQFLDSMSMALRGKPVRRLPAPVLQRAGEAGTLVRRVGLPFPLDRERVMRMSTDYVVPLEATHRVMAFPYVPFDVAMGRTADWYKAGAEPAWEPKPGIPATAGVSRSCVVAIGPFPPFVGGAAKNTAIVCDALEARGAKVCRLATNKTPRRAEHARSLAIYGSKTLGFARNIRRITSPHAAAAGATVYLVPDGGPGVAFSAAYARTAVAKFPRLVVHHRSYNHLHNRSDLMARLLHTAPDKTLHVFLDPVMENQFKTVYSTDLRSMYVPNAATCDLELAEPGPDTDEHAPVTVGFLSNLVEDKGFDVVADAFPKLAEQLGADARFLLAGRPLGSANAARLTSLQRVLGDRLDYRGEVFGVAKTAFFQECDVFVFPTRFSQEAQPNVLYEAMAGGAAIVATRWAGVPWVLQDTVGRIIEAGPDRSDDLVAAVENLIDSDELPNARRHQVEAFRAKKSDADTRYAEFLDYVLGEALLPVASHDIRTSAPHTLGP